MMLIIWPTLMKSPLSSKIVARIRRAFLRWVLSERSTMREGLRMRLMRKSQRKLIRTRPGVAKGVKNGNRERRAIGFRILRIVKSLGKVKYGSFLVGANRRAPLLVEERRGCDFGMYYEDSGGQYSR